MARVVAFLQHLAKICDHFGASDRHITSPVDRSPLTGFPVPHGAPGLPALLVDPDNTSTDTEHNMGSIGRTSEHYVNPSSIIAIAVIFPVLTALLVSNRALSRYLKGADYGLDDYLSLASAVVLFGCSVDLIVGVSTHTVGHHSKPSATDFNVPGISTLDKVEWSFNLLWYIGIMLVKLSLLFFYRRIFRGRWFSAVNFTMMVLVTAWGLTFFFTTLFQCGSDIDLNWSPLPQFFNPKCANSLAVFFVNSLLSCFFDVVILIIPMPLIWNLNMNKRLKLVVTGMFALGGFCVGASALRLTLYSELWWAVRTHNTAASILGLTGADDFGIVSLALFWSQIELGVANVTCCLPSLKVVIDSEAFRNLPSVLSLTSLRNAFGSGGSRSHDDGRDNEMPEEGPRTRIGEVSLQSHNNPHVLKYDRSTEMQLYHIAGEGRRKDSPIQNQGVIMRRA